MVTLLVCHAPLVSAVGQLHDASTRSRRCKSVHGLHRTILPQLHNPVLLQLCDGFVLGVHVHELHDRHVRRGLRRELQRSSRGRRRSADQTVRERRRRFSESGIVLPAGARAACARPAAVCARRLPPQGARDGSNPADRSARIRADSALIACARTGLTRPASRPPP